MLLRTLLKQPRTCCRCFAFLDPGWRWDGGYNTEHCAHGWLGLAWIWRAQQGVGLWQPSTAACLQMYLASSGRNSVSSNNGTRERSQGLDACLHCQSAGVCIVWLRLYVALCSQLKESFQCSHLMVIPPLHLPSIVALSELNFVNLSLPPAEFSHTFDALCYYGSVTYRLGKGQAVILLQQRSKALL